MYALSILAVVFLFPFAVHDGGQAHLTACVVASGAGAEWFVLSAGDGIDHAENFSVIVLND